MGNANMCETRGNAMEFFILLLNFDLIFTIFHEKSFSYCSSRIKIFRSINMHIIFLMNSVQ